MTAVSGGTPACGGGWYIMMTEASGIGRQHPVPFVSVRMRTHTNYNYNRNYNYNSSSSFSNKRNYKHK